MAIGRFNFGNGGASSGALFPIYQQLTEPTKKEGLWIKSNEKLKDIFVGNENEPTTKEWLQLENPSFSGTNDLAVKDGKIYIHSSSDVYEYNPKNGTTTLVYTGLPTSYKLSHYVDGAFYYISANVRSTSTEYTAYKFNPKDKTQTELKKVTHTYGGCQTICVGDYIYLYFTGSSSGSVSLYRYDIVNNNFLSGSFKTRYNVSTTKKGNDIYYFFDGNIYKYDTLTNVSTQLISVIGRYAPKTSPRIVAVGDDIYIYGGVSDYDGSGSNIMDFRRYNIASNTLTNLGTTPVAFYLAGAVSLNGKIYFFGVPNNAAYRFKYETELTDGIYLFLNLASSEEVDGFLFSELYKNIKNLKIYKNNEQLNCQLYIGDGTSWSEIGGGLILRNILRNITTFFKRILSLEVPLW